MEEASDQGWAPVSVADVPEGARGRWCVLTTATEGSRHRAPWRLVVFEGADGARVGSPHYLRRWRLGRRYRTVAYVPEEALRFRGAQAALRFTTVPRAWAAMLILLEGGRGMPGVVRLAAGGDVRRARTALVLLAASLHRPDGYKDWVRLFDRWPETPLPRPAGPSIAALVFAQEPGPALTATMESLAAQGMQAAVVTGGEPWRAALSGTDCAYVAVLQTGELLPRHAGWYAAWELERLGRPALAYADQDGLGADGVRSAPAFRPMPGRFLMLSGTLARGVWFVRRDVLLAVGEDTAWAECLRLALWLRRDEMGEEGGVRIPVVLTHRRWDAEAAPAAAVAAVAGAHLARTGLPMRVSTEGYPMVVRAAARTRHKVSVLVPSGLRTALVARCIRSVADDLAGRDVELVVGVSQPGALDAGQAAAAAGLGAVGVRVVHLPFPAFNFSRVCNALAGMTSGELILLLNDDVSVIEQGWLDEMAAPMGDARVGIVGAKLLYPDRSIQHGGVIMGLSGLCDHASRGLTEGDERANVTREFSAVTAACLLVRRSVYEGVGGLDETYPSAFNDVDFCLRVGEAGHAVVYAPGAALVHHEMQTYGSHYKGDRAPFQMEETARMRRRWAPVVADDPYHSPDLDVAPGREWSLAFPPRRPRTFEIMPE